jgi:ubiquitin-like-conjugating enzyme ATG3
MQNLLHSVGEALTPVLKESNFLETGRLTPEEFVAAGDYLVYKCPTWSWSAGDPSKRRSFLPAGKQFLITKAVPCLLRVSQMDTLREDCSGASMPGWTDTIQGTTSNGSPDDFITLDGEDKSLTDLNRQPSPVSLASSQDNNIDNIPDMETFNEEDNVIRFADPEQFKPTLSHTGSNVVKSRTYDLSITYDKYYQTPRLWLYGLDENGTALDPSQVFEDISQEHARKTVTIETHPHLPDLCIASIHPCKHANVMRSIISYMQSAQRDQDYIRVDRYLVLFLKFMGCVLPTIEYDHTMSI